MPEEELRLFELPDVMNVVDEHGDEWRLIHVKEHWRKVRVKKGDTDG